MGRLERQERIREEMRQMIASAAMKLFLTEGFEKTSMRRIAEEIDYTPGAIYSYFKDKNEILFALHTKGFEKLYAMQLKARDAADPLERLYQQGETYLRFAAENPEYYELMFNKQINLGYSVQPGKRSYELLRDDVRACMDAGRLPKNDIEAASLAFWGLVHGLASLANQGCCSPITGMTAFEATKAALRFTVQAMARGG